MRTLSLTVAMVVFVWTARICTAETGDGSIAGTVRLRGNAPNIPLVYAEQDPDVCGDGARPSQSLLLGTNQAVEDVIVYLAGPMSGGAHASSDSVPAILDMRNCEFVPRIQIARAGATFVLKNSDPVLHVVRIASMSGTNGPVAILKVAAPYAGFEKRWKLTDWHEPTLLQVTSGNGHNWLAGYIAVMPHPWAALPDENGRFTIRGVPAGTYKLCAWHEALGTLTRDVRVAPDRVATTDFEFSTERSHVNGSQRPDRDVGAPSRASR